MRKGQQSAKEKGHRRVWKAEPTKRPHTPERVELPKRMHLPRMPTPAMPPHVGRWLWTCRAGFEAQLFEELGWARLEPSLLAPALCSSLAPGAFVPAFARMGFLVDAVVTSAAGAHEALPLEPTKVQVWAPDTDAGNSLSSDCTGWEAVISGLRTGAVVDPATPWKAYEAGAWLGQVCLASRGVAAVGRVRAREAASLSAGGRTRMKRTAEAPSRAAMKLDEALDWYGVAPGKGDLCVDLGSAPGGWTRRLVERGARVWSVDPARLAPDLAKHAKVRHFLSSAFEFVPPEPVEWLFCDMAWRPLEVASLLGKWARNRWAMQLVSNIKLPMKDKLPTLVRVRHTLESAGWTRVRMRQLYHDRDELTLTARREV
jgi:23S rRNA (cytidine2498-2'-O)-methyltransferase